jgi:hypothetical protein
MTIKTETRSSANVDADARLERVRECIRERLSKCFYQFQFKQITWRFDEGVLTLNGDVPTFYMKQVLQTVLRDIEDVRQIDNRVRVLPR